MPNPLSIVYIKKWPGRSTNHKDCLFNLHHDDSSVKKLEITVKIENNQLEYVDARFDDHTLYRRKEKWLDLFFTSWAKTDFDNQPYFFHYDDNENCIACTLIDESILASAKKEEVRQDKESESIDNLSPNKISTTEKNSAFNHYNTLKEMKSPYQLIRVNKDSFDRLKITTNNSSNLRTFKNNTAKVYFIYIDEEHNIHYIGKKAHFGIINKIASTKAIKEGDKSIIELINKEKSYPHPDLFLFYSMLILLSLTIAITTAKIAVAINIAMPLIASALGVSGAMALYCLTFAILPLGLCCFAVSLMQLLSDPNPSNLTRAIMGLSGIASGSMLGATIGTLILPGFGTFLGLGIGFFIAAFACINISLYDFCKKNINWQKLQKKIYQLNIGQNHIRLHQMHQTQIM